VTSRDHGGLTRTRGPGRRLGRQTLVIAVVSSLVAGGVLVGLVAWTASGLAKRSADQVLADTSDAMVDALSVDANGRFVVPEANLEPGVVVYDDAGTVVAGTPTPALAKRFAELSSVTGVHHGQVDESFRLRAASFTVGGRRGVVVAAISTHGYEEAVNFAIAVAAAAALALVALTSGAAFAVSRQTWRRVSAMALTAETWSERHLERRFDVGASGHELSVLAATLNGLLDKVAQALGAEQRMTAELAHELRSPLAAAQGLTELLSARNDLDDSMREDLAQLEAACRRMGDTITTLLGLARQGPRSAVTGTPLTAVLDALLAGLPPDAAITLPSHQALEPFVLAGERDPMVRVLAPLVDNALRHAERVRISAEWHPDGHFVLVQVDDDGTGLDPTLSGDVFQPGVSTSHGAGLGLSLARRVARSLGGDVELASPPTGWSTRFTVRLPRS
jgi:two-component system OmpR family sensor kinase